MAQNRRLLIAIALVAAFGLVLQFGFRNVHLNNEVYYSSAPDELPGFVAVEMYVCPECEAEIRTAWAARHDTSSQNKLPEGMSLAYEEPTEDGFCRFHSGTRLEARRDLPIEPGVITGLPAQTEFINRRYVERDRNRTSVDSIHLTIVISQRDRRSIHRPESCLYSQGWNQTVPPTEMNVPCSGRPNNEIRVRKLLMEQTVKTRSGQPALLHLVVNTWYAAPPDRVTPTELNYLLQMFYDRLFNGINYRWSSVLISSRAFPGEDKDRAAGRLKQFVQEFSEWAEAERHDAERANELEGGGAN
ncbi:MAG: exosortase-associated EpsI family protein [Verrucomicrobia bacterium]|nr:exosortase-associated EpsI family protein [Verrucomicrobiota bacterium]